MPPRAGGADQSGSAQHSAVKRDSVMPGIHPPGHPALCWSATRNRAGSGSFSQTFGMNTEKKKRPGHRETSSRSKMQSAGEAKTRPGPKKTGHRRGVPGPHKH